MGRLLILGFVRGGKTFLNDWNFTMPHHTITALLSAALIAPIALAEASAPRALVNTDPNGSLALPDGTIVSSFVQARLRLSSRGSWWALTAFATGQPSSNDTFVLVGTAAGLDRAIGETVAQPGLGVGFTGVPNAQLGVNESGDLALKSTTNGPVSANEVVARQTRTTGAWTLIAREGDPLLVFPGESHSVFLDSVTLLDSGRVLYRSASTSGPLGSDFDDHLLLSDPAASALQSGAITPLAQLGGTTAIMTKFNDEAFVSEPNESGQQLLLVDGDLGPPVNNRVLAVGPLGGPLTVIVQRGASLPGLPGELPYSSGSLTDGAQLYAGGDWAVWGTSAGGLSYLIVNGTPRVIEGDPIPDAQPGEVVKSVQHAAMNSLGELAYFVESSQSRNYLVVERTGKAPVAVARSFNSTLEIASATQVDYNGDGFLDDAHCGFFNDNNLGLSDDGEVYFVGRVTSALTGLNVGDGVFVISLPSACVGDLNADGIVDAADLGTLLGAWGTPGATDLDGNGTTGAEDLALLLGAWGTC
jgi:hypothetical protein